MGRRLDEPERVFEHLYAKFGADVLAFCRRRASVEVAEEATAETFLVVWRRLEEVPDSPRGWLLGIARRTLANQRRSARRREALVARLGLEAEQHAGSDGAPVLEALASLSELDQEALLVTAWEGLSSAEAAQVLGCSAAAYRVRLFRARRRLEQALRTEVTGSIGFVKEDLT